MGAESMLDVPSGSAAGGHAAAARLEQCARQARTATARWDGTAAPAWWGQASVGFSDSRVRLSRQVADLASMSDLLGDAVRQYSQEMAVVLPSWRAAATDHDRAQRLALEGSDPLGERLASAEAEVARWHGRAETAGASLVAAARAVVSGLQPYSELERQLDDGLRTFVQVGIVEPVTSTAFLALGWVTDRDRWSAEVSAMPGAAVEAVKHPWDSFRSALRTTLDVDDFEAGRWGAGLGSVAGTGLAAAGFGKNPLKGTRVTRAVRERFPGAAFPSHLPPPRLQTFDEMLTDGVDLSRSEHTALGHTLRRHVDVDDDYLRDRLDHGTIRDDWTRGDFVPTASAWDDLATAEATVGRSLLAHEEEIRARMSAQPAGGIYRFVDTTTDGSTIGRSMWDNDSGGHVERSARFEVRLRWTATGELVVISAFPERP